MERLSSGELDKPNFSLCGITLFRRSGQLSKRSSKGSSSSRASELGNTPSLEQATTSGTLKHPRRRPDSPRDQGEAEVAFQPLKRQHSSSMDDDSLPAPAIISSSQLSDPAQASPGAPSTSETVTVPRPHRLSCEVKSHSFPQSHRRSHVLQTEEGPISPRPAAGPHLLQHTCPPYGHKAVIGRRPKMEDAYSAVPFLLEVPISQSALDELVPPRIASSVRNIGSASSRAAASASDASTATNAAAGQQQAHSSSMGGEFSGTSVPAATGAGQPGSLSLQLPDSGDGGGGGSSEELLLEPLHFFGVFDGHGGADAALHCAKTMHERVREVILSITSPTAHSATCAVSSHPAPEASSSGTDRAAVATGAQGTAANPGTRSSLSGRPSPSDSDYTDAAADMADPASSTGSEASFLDCDPSQEPERAEGMLCSSETVEAALTKAFHMTDEEFGQAENAALVGTTAVVALVGSRMLYVANCGDSRAVLCRDGMAVALTDDHKAAREDETARVEAAGGQILFWNGVRVMGVLAVSRAIGDHCLRPFVIAQPEVTIILRHSQDELLLLASDGLWDVMNNQEACTLAKKCLQRARQRGATRAKASSIAASVLVRAAVDRGSRDNVTVVIVDLSPASPEELAAEAQQAENSCAEDAAGGEREVRGGSKPGDGEAAAPTRRKTPPEQSQSRQQQRPTPLPPSAVMTSTAPAALSPFASMMAPAVASPFEQMQQEGDDGTQPQAQQEAGTMLSPFGSVPLPEDESSPSPC